MRISDWSSDVCSSDLMTDDGVALVASMDDLLAHKLKAIHDRAEAKDYEDIAAILKNGHPLERGLAAREALFGPSVPDMVTLKALTYFADDSEPERRTEQMQWTITARPEKGGAGMRRVSRSSTWWSASMQTKQK